MDLSGRYELKNIVYCIKNCSYGLKNGGYGLKKTSNRNEHW